MKVRQLPALTLVISLSALTGCGDLLDPDEPGNLVPKTVTEDPLLPRIEVNGTLLHAESFGDIGNPIVIFLHGGPGSDYRALISEVGVENASRYPDERTITNGGLTRLQDEYFCVFYDQRGGGLSPRFDKGVINFDMYVADLDAVIDFYLQEKADETSMVEDQVRLVAWSYGAILATGYINAHPEKVADLVVYEPGPISKTVWDYFIDNSTSVMDQIGEEWLDEFLLSHNHITPDSHARADYQMLLGAGESQPELHQDPNTPLWRLGAYVGDENLDFVESDCYDITSNLSAFQGRLLYMLGSLTEVEYPVFPDLWLAYYPQSERMTIAGVGHTGIWEKSGEVAQEIRSFLSQ